MDYPSIPRARVVNSDPIYDHSPIGKVELAFDLGYTGSIGLPVYYFKGPNNRAIAEGTNLVNVSLHPLRIPKEFKWVKIQEMRNLSFESPPSNQGLGEFKEETKGTIEITHPLKLNRQSNTSEDLTGLFMLGFSPLILNLKVALPLAGRPKGIPKYSGIDGCPKGIGGLYINEGYPRLPSEPEANVSPSQQMEERIDNIKTNLINCVFNFRHHYFIPLTHPNGNTFYYAFEHEDIIRYWLYKEMKAIGAEKPFALAANAPVYSENILGIEICKDIKIVPVGSTPTPFR